MNPIEALENVIDKALAGIQCTRAEHTLMMQAYTVVRERLVLCDKLEAEKSADENP